MATTSVAFDSTSYAAARAYDDLSLVHACKNGDTSAFEQLVRRYDTKLFRIAQHITHNREDAQDAVQDAFLKVFRKLSQYRENSQFSTWLIWITINESLMKPRKQRSSAEVSIAEDSPDEGQLARYDLADWVPDPEKLYQGSEVRDILRTELQKLRPGLRVVFVLRDVEELSSDKTAEVLSLTPVAVKARLWRARLQLRQQLSKYFGEEVTHN
jgi:RNA polymerase sigma-70 factor (ECF subfamily)